MSKTKTIAETFPPTESELGLDTVGKTITKTLFTTTIGESRMFFKANNWIKVKMRLETAGPVAVGTDDVVGPVIGGQGALLSADELVLTLKKGDRLSYAANAVNRVRLIFEPVPWIEQVLLRVSDVVNVLSAIAGRKSPTSTSRKAPSGPVTGNVRGHRW